MILSFIPFHMAPVTKKLLPAVILLLCFCVQSGAQNKPPVAAPPQLLLKVPAEVVGNDTIPVFNLYPVYVYTDYVFKNKRQYEQWTRVKYNVKKVYPYAILAAAKLKEYDRVLERMPDEKMRKTYLGVCERELKNEFEDELKDLSITQGRILMKLIDRETGKTTYEIVKQMRGGFQAVMWQAVARVFGNNMKDEYDSAGEDVMIERAIHLVETGQF
jgi:hypothetical protein